MPKQKSRRFRQNKLLINSSKPGANELRLRGHLNELRQSEYQFGECRPVGYLPVVGARFAC